MLPFVVVYSDSLYNALPGVLFRFVYEKFKKYVPSLNLGNALMSNYGTNTLLKTLVFLMKKWVSST